MIRRATIIVSGTVQEAGYREEVAEKAFDLFLKGCVRNQDDGNVEIICEGEKSAIRELARRIRFREYPVEVETVRCRYSEPTGEFGKFTIIKDARLDSDYSAKMETGFRFIKHMHRDLAGTMKGVGSQVGSVGSDVRAMDRNMGGHFNRLDSKYDSFGRTLKTVSRDMKGMKSSMSSMASDTRALRRAATAGRSRQKRARSRA